MCNIAKIYAAEESWDNNAWVGQTVVTTEFSLDSLFLMD